MRVETIIMFKNPETGSITHEDQESSGLEFREIMRNSNNEAVYLMRGEESKVSDYLSRHAGEAYEISEIAAKTEYDTVFPIKKIPCQHCNGTGFDTIQEFTEVRPWK